MRGAAVGWRNYGLVACDSLREVNEEYRNLFFGTVSDILLHITNKKINNFAC